MASRLPWPNWTAALLALENASVAGFRLVCIRSRVRAIVSSVAWWAASNPFRSEVAVAELDSRIARLGKRLGRRLQIGLHQVAGPSHSLVGGLVGCVEPIPI